MCIKNVLEFPLLESRSRGRPAKNLLSCVEKNMEFYGLENADTLNKAEWSVLADCCIPQLQYNLI